MCIFVLFSQTLKSIIREPRPLMVDEDIQIKDCKHMEFGNPSSHTFGSAFMYTVTGYLFVKNYYNKHGKKQSLFATLAVVNSMMIGVYVIGFSRVFKGVHTYNQVLSGIIFGSLMALMQCFVFYESFFKFFASIRKRTKYELVFNSFTAMFVILATIGTIVH